MSNCVLQKTMKYDYLSMYWLLSTMSLKCPWISMKKNRFREMVLWACAIAWVPGKLYITLRLNLRAPADIHANVLSRISSDCSWHPSWPVERNAKQIYTWINRAKIIVLHQYIINTQYPCALSDAGHCIFTSHNMVPDEKDSVFIFL